MKSGLYQITFVLDDNFSFQILFPLLISTSLFSINYLLLKRIKRDINHGDRLRRRSSVFTGSIKSDCSTDSQSGTRGALHVVLLGCVALYFLTQMPSLIINILEHFFVLPVCGTSPTNELRPIVWTITLVNYSVNFAVYMLTSQQYRKNVKSLCFHTYRPASSRVTSDY